MKITPINNTINYKINPPAFKKQEISFKSIFPDNNTKVMNSYIDYGNRDNDFLKLQASSTRIFRELPSQIAISKLVDPNKKTEVKVLGCSDGSEAWGYAIALNESLGKAAQENVKIKAVDNAQYMIDVAKTGKIVCSDIERKYANNSDKIFDCASPIANDGWDKYLKLTNRPEDFDKIISEYPLMRFYEKDPVAKKEIGKGLNWFEINKEELPDVKFIKDDIFNQLTPDKDSSCTVYVVANTAGYLFGFGADAYIHLFKKIKEENEGTNRKVYVVVGKLENTILSTSSMRPYSLKQKEQNKVRISLQELGFEKVSKHKLRKKGVGGYDDAASKIYELR